MRIGVTGSTGFVGKRYMLTPVPGYEKYSLDLRSTAATDFDLRDTTAIVHLAGKAHEMKPVPDSDYFSVNFSLTKSLADHAKLSGVRQFIYISSTKVYGDEVHSVLNEHSPCTPTDAYGKSKYQAEQYLLSISSDDFKVAIVRPPLVYGPEVKGNMIKLLQLADRKIPLPLGNTNNARSMVFIDNLIALIDKLMVEAKTGVFIGGDPSTLTTDELVRTIRKYLGNSAGLISIPFAVRPLIKMIRPALYIRLFGSFVVDNSETNERLNFVPPFSSDHGIGVMTKWYLSQRMS